MKFQVADAHAFQNLLRAATLLFNGAGRTTLTYLGNGTRTSQTHDAVGQVTDITHFKSDNTLLAGQSYEYNAIGNKLRVAESSGDRVTWTYDDNSRLISEHRTGTQPYRRGGTP